MKNQLKRKQINLFCIKHIYKRLVYLSLAHLHAPAVSLQTLHVFYRGRVYRFDASTDQSIHVYVIHEDGEHIFLVHVFCAYAWWLIVCAHRDYVRMRLRYP